MTLPNNTLLQGGKYRIVRFISSGGFGCTYEAEHVMLGKRVAIKEFFVKDFCNRDETTSHVIVGTQSKVALVSKLKKKFIEEASALSRFNHPNIVHVSDVFEENGTAYYVMDFINGKSIHEILKMQPTIPETKAVKYITQIAEALKQVHAQNILHLDIKPGNIIIDSNDNAILIDFGASKQYDEVAGENTSTLVGRTPGYAPLEQLGNSIKQFSPATDIYALGATLYKMLTGKTPPEAADLASGEQLPQLPINVSGHVKNAVYKAMQLQKNNRPQEIAEFLQLLGDNAENDEDTLVGENQKPEPDKPKEPKPGTENIPTPKKGNKWIFKLIVTLIVVIIGVVGVVGYINDSDDVIVGTREGYSQEQEGAPGSSDMVVDSPTPREYDEVKENHTGEVISLNNDYMFTPKTKVKKFTVLYFNAIWCVPCTKLTPAIDLAAKHFEDKVNFYSIDIDNNVETAHAFNISSVPIIVFISPDGSVKTYEGLGPFIGNATDITDRERTVQIIYKNLTAMINQEI